MSILIKGMEMPVTCCHCPLMGYDPEIEWNDGGREAEGAYICVMTHELIDNTKREDHCPLVPVPPHGRLGDLDALAEEDNRQYDEYRKDNGLDDTCHRSIQWMLSSAPTIIPAEEET